MRKRTLFPTPRPNQWPVLAAAALIVAACIEEPAGLVTAVILAVLDGDNVSQVFVVENTNDAGPGSLRQAITEANAAGGKDGVTFEIPGAGPHTIQPKSPLPFITDPIVIDGYTQSGASPNTNPAELGSNAVLKIELDGSMAGVALADGLSLSAGYSTIRGLAINRFAQDGIVAVADGNVFEGNFIGTDIAGSSATASLGNGIKIRGSNNVVGGSSAGARNVISGNRNNGVLISGPGSTNNRVEGNLIGVDATGTVAIGNGIPEPASSNSAAVLITEGASHNIIGGTRNVISGNHRTGVWINLEAANNIVHGNFIGNDVSGTMPLGNARWGVVIQAPHNTITSNRVVWNGHDGVLFALGASQNILGGTGVTPGTCDGPCNVIAFNATAHNIARGGVRVFATAGTGNAVLGNSIFSNLLGLGIDLGNTRGVTPNDAGDIDIGPNDFQNFPALTSARARPGELIVRGTIDTPNPRTVTIEFFANSVPTPGSDPSGHGEGAVFLGRATPNVLGRFTATLPPVLTGTVISATATDANGNTSEFAANIAAAGTRHVDAVLLGTIEWPFTAPLDRATLPSLVVVEAFYNGFFNSEPCVNANTTLADVSMPWNSSGITHRYDADNDPAFLGFTQCMVNGTDEHIAIGVDEVSMWGVEESIALDTGAPDLAGNTIDFIDLVVDDISMSGVEPNLTVHIAMRWLFYGHESLRNR